MKKLIILAIVLRLGLAVFYFHPDIKTYNFQSSFFKKGVFNIYSYLLRNRDKLPLKEEFVYFPATYVTLGFYQTIISPFTGGVLDSWLNNADVNTMVTDRLIFWNLFILKLPILLTDLFIFYCLYKFYGKNTSLIWLFNPFTLIIFYVFSNIDIFPITFTLLSLIMAQKGKFNISGILLGLAAGYKAYPLLLAPFLFNKGKTLKEKFIYSLIPFIVFGLIIVPYWSPEFIKSALVSGLTTRIVTPLFIIFYITFFIYSVFFEKKFKLEDYWAAVLLLVYSTANFHIQWLSWVAPFLIILVDKKPKLLTLICLIAVLAIVIPLLSADKYMSVSLLRVFNPVFDLVASPYEILARFIDPQIIQKYLHLSLIPLSAVILYKSKKYA